MDFITEKKKEKTFEEEILLDEDNLELLDLFNWHKTPQGYVRSNKHILMHHHILPCKKGFHVDHINGNKLDNRKKNLRYATPSENALNRHSKSTSNTGERNIYKLQNCDKYMVRFTRNYKYIYVGVYETVKEAKIVRDNYEFQ